MAVADDIDGSSRRQGWQQQRVGMAVAEGRDGSGRGRVWQ